MKTHTRLKLPISLIFSLFLANVSGQFSSFAKQDLGYAEVDPDIGRRSDVGFIGDDEDIKFDGQEPAENEVDAKYQYSFNVIDEEEQVYQSQTQSRDNGVGIYSH